MGNFLRAHLPEVQPVFLVSRYAAPLLAHHVPPFGYVVWEKQRLSRQYEAVIHAFPRLDIAWAAYRSGIERRIGTYRRWYHWLLCTDLVNLRRRSSGKHEAWLNLQLLLPLLPSSLQEKVKTLEWESLLLYRARLQSQAPLPLPLLPEWEKRKPKIILHVGTGGGAPRWLHWKQLAQLLLERFPEALLILTGTQAEKPLTTSLQAEFLSESLLDTAGHLSLPQLITLLSQADGLIAGSTGPLHIAAALETPVVGLYPATSATGPWRWKPLTLSAVILGGQSLCRQCKPLACPCLNSISPSEVVEALESLLSRPRAVAR